MKISWSDKEKRKEHFSLRKCVRGRQGTDRLHAKTFTRGLCLHFMQAEEVGFRLDTYN